MQFNPNTCILGSLFYIIFIRKRKGNFSIDLGITADIYNMYLNLTTSLIPHAALTFYIFMVVSFFFYIEKDLLKMRNIKIYVFVLVLSHTNPV